LGQRATVIVSPKSAKFDTISAVSDVTQMLTAIEQGDPQAADKLLPLVYEELRKLWMRLVGQENPKFANRAHFFAAAAEAMRRILIDNARRKRALRHGGGQQRVDLDLVDVASASDDDQLLAVNDALDKLAAQSKSEAELVKLRRFVGMTLEEA